MRHSKAMGLLPETRVEQAPVIARGWLAVAFVVLIAVFFVFNRGAYKGYFPDDDLDNMGHARGLDTSYLVKKLLSPALDPNNFRPAAFSYYFVLERAASFQFGKYIAVLHVIHLLNAWLLWCFARRLGLSIWQAGAAVLFFALHMAAFDIYWKPMYIFDLLCGTFALATLNLYARGWLLSSIVTFWLAFKCKEIVILLPLAVTAWEWMFGPGGRAKYTRLAPFYLISLCFGLQALSGNQQTSGNYHLQFSGGAIGKSLRFYSSEWLLVPKLGMGVALLLLFSRDKRIRLGLILLLLPSAPMLLLPERLYAAYIYVPLIGLAIALGTLVEGRAGIVAALVFFAAWLPWDHSVMREKRKAALAAADEARTWVDSAVPWAKAHPAITTFIYDGAPVSMNRWGQRGALSNLGNPRVEAEVFPADGDLKAAIEKLNLAVLLWDPIRKSIAIVERTPQTPDASAITVSPTMPIWQFGQGWMGREGRYRWSKPSASARLLRPVGAREFSAIVNVSQAYLDAVKESELTILLNGEEVVRQRFTSSGWLTKRWAIPERAAGVVDVQFKVSPIFHPNAEDKTIEYGLPFAGFGFPGTAGASGTNPAP